MGWFRSPATGSACWLVACMLTAPVWAQPLSNPRCASRTRLQHPPAGAGAFFDRSCSTAYVAPPAFGEVELGAVQPKPALALCPRLNVAIAGVANALDRVAQLVQELDSLTADIAPWRARVAALELEVDLAAIERDAALEALLSAEVELVEAEWHWLSALDELDFCLLLASAPGECGSEQERAWQAETDLVELERAHWLPAQEAAERADERYREAWSRYEAQAHWFENEVLAPTWALTAELHAAQAAADGALTGYAGLEGAVATLRYHIPWAELVASYAAINAGQGLRFQRLPLDTTRFVAQARLQGHPSSLPAVLWTRATRPKGSSISEKRTLEEPPLEPDAVAQVEVGLSLLGACPLLGASVPRPLFLPSQGGARSLPSPERRALAPLSAHVVANWVYDYRLFPEHPLVAQVDWLPWEEHLGVLAREGSSAPLRTVLAALGAVRVAPQVTTPARRVSALERPEPLLPGPFSLLPELRPRAGGPEEAAPERSRPLPRAKPLRSFAPTPRPSDVRDARAEVLLAAAEVLAEGRVAVAPAASSADGSSRFAGQRVAPAFQAAPQELERARSLTPELRARALRRLAELGSGLRRQGTLTFLSERSAPPVPAASPFPRPKPRPLPAAPGAGVHASTALRANAP